MKKTSLALVVAISMSCGWGLGQEEGLLDRFEIVYSVGYLYGFLEGRTHSTLVVDCICNIEERQREAEREAYGR